MRWWTMSDVIQHLRRRYAYAPPFVKAIVGLFDRPWRIWQAGGWPLKMMALYVPLSPILVSFLSGGKLLGCVQTPWWVIGLLVATGHFNSLVAIPFVIRWHDRRLTRPIS